MRVLVLLLVLSSVAFADKLVTVRKNDIKLEQQIFFAFGKPTIKQESIPLLDHLVAVLAKEKRIGVLEIGVHTDARGNDEWNLELSQKRADAIRDYLIGKGIDQGRLRAKGYGETKPIDKGTSAAAMARNRRTELLIVQP
jgi:outer membrane protein OmpA-like peptidoglycan-associated protein